MIRKSGGRVCGGGHDCDKIIERAAPYRIYDLVASAGSHAARPVFNQEHVNGKPSDFYEPLPYDAEPDSAPPLQLPSYEDLGGDAFFRTQVGVPLAADMALVGQPLNDGSSVWFSRTTYDLIRTFLEHGDHSEAPTILKHHRNEWRTILGLPPL